MSAQTRKILQGGYYEIPFAFTDANGAAIDMTVAGHVGMLRASLVGGSSDLNLTTASNASWTSQAGGTGKWLLTAALSEAMTAGTYIVEVRYEEGASTKPHLVGKTTWAVFDSDTGLI